MRKDENGKRIYVTGSYEGRWLEEFQYMADILERIEKKIDKITKEDKPKAKK